MFYGREIIDHENGGVYNIIHGDDFENVDPERKIFEQIFFPCMHFRKQEAFSQIPPALRARMNSDAEKSIMTEVFRKANEDAMTEVNNIKAIQLPEELLSIFTGLKKDVEEKLFENVALTTQSFVGLLLHAGSLGYKYSFYTFKQNPTGTDINSIPRFAHKDEVDSSIFKTDDTTLKDGQVKSLIDQTSTTVVKMLDNGRLWHCFFATFKGLAGKEKDHDSHMHYISSSWGLTREQVLAKLSTKNYSIPSVHVWYSGH